ncbi:hypothetical protein [Companilactobacillus sp.]|uniref:hypothetical protein n=1 Tax=Companilactobacillus sp. TaxID=2767905 RepID=UPI0025C61524|nr:hypothetical protein [Companilactobacillus sp.]MCH4008203.1 hypothetical protein [Companilactobacillus sp.]MCH4051618.1 hypothetical protein [Companilactobacillus sp.]MCH4076146.1 hypothetical protein [Companilactobacillus sp.]MCH4124721.1 hypothetical protein [Companilactobacillus sp.]MCH4131263.1 hypothetical protein [Companilactobacillus sp.]
MKNLWTTVKKSKTTYITLISLVLAFIMPILLNVFHLGRSNRIIFLFFVINILFAGFMGWFAKKYSLSFYNLIIFPVIFVISVFAKYGRYGYFLAGIYLVLSILIYFLFDD